MAENQQKQQNNNEKKKFSIENIKKIDLKKIIKFFTLIWGLVLIILMTITNIGIDKNFVFLTWLSNSLIIFGIIVFGLLMGETSGNDKQMSKPDGLYQQWLKKYNDYNDSISEKLIYFNQFYSWLLPKEIYAKKIDYLIMMGVDSAKAEKIVKYCTLSDLEEMKDHVFAVKDNDGKIITLIRKLEPYEVDPVTDVLNGYIKLNAANANYFLTAFADAKLNDRIVEEGKSLNKSRKVSRNANRAFKLTTSLGISLIWGLLTVQEFISGDDTQAWVNLTSRITALCTSFFSGWLSSIVDIKYRARILENKYKILEYFNNCLTNKIFIPKQEEELAKEEYEEYLKEEEEAKKKVITPELVDESKNEAQNGSKKGEIAIL